jgi:Arc/MetJ family transcription regulator
MTRTVEGVEELMLEEAQKILGTKSNRDTVNAALREVVKLRLVEQFFANMSSKDPQELEQMRAEAWR